MSLEQNLRDAAPAIAPLGEDAENYWFLADLYDRILTGDLLDPEDAQELLAEYLEDEDDDELPEALVAAIEADEDAITLELVRVIWQSAAEEAEAWVDDHTDTDRFFDALDELEDEDIDAGVFTDHASVPARPGQRGAVVLWVNSWEQFDAEEATDALLTVTGADAGIADEVAAALRNAGLTVVDVAAEGVTVRLQWRHHVESWDDASGASGAQ
jgi:hypothetical protein